MTMEWLWIDWQMTKKWLTPCWHYARKLTTNWLQVVSWKSSGSHSKRHLVIWWSTDYHLTTCDYHLTTTWLLADLSFFTECDHLRYRLVTRYVLVSLLLSWLLLCHVTYYHMSTDYDSWLLLFLWWHRPHSNFSIVQCDLLYSWRHCSHDVYCTRYSIVLAYYK